MSCPVHQWTHPTEPCPYCREIGGDTSASRPVVATNIDGQPSPEPADADRAHRLTRAIEAAIVGDVTRFEELFTPDVVGSGPALSVTSRDELTTGVKEHRGALADVEVAFAPLDVSGPQAAVEWVASAVHAPLTLEQPADSVPTGRRIRVRAVTVAEFEGRRIRSFRSYWDDCALVPGPGAVPAR